MKERLKKWKYRVWDEYNPEGIRGKDAFCIILFFIVATLSMMNLMLWLDKPEQLWIGKMLFPMAN